MHETVSKILAPLQERRDYLQSEIANYMAEIGTLKEEIKVIDRVLKAANTTEPKPKRTSGGNSSGRAKDIKGTPMTIERSEKILHMMGAHPEKEDWSAKEVATKLDMPISSVNVALTYMRQEQMIRATRTIQGGGNAYAPWES